MTHHRHKNPKKDEDGLLPEDKRKINHLSDEKQRHLESIEDLNYQIYLVQSSTSTLFPKFIRLHHFLRQRIRWYYNWHNKAYAPTIHWMVLILYVIALPLLYFFAQPNIETVHAFEPTKIEVVLPGQIYKSSGQLIGTPRTIKSGETVRVELYGVNNNDQFTYDASKVYNLFITTNDPKAEYSSSGSMSLSRANTDIKFKTVGTWTISVRGESLIPTPTPIPTDRPRPTATETPTPTPIPVPTPTPVPGGVGPPDLTNNLFSKALAADSISGSSTITVTAGEPTKLAFSGMPASLVHGEVSKAISCNLYDAMDNQTSAGGDFTVHFSTSSTGGKFSLNAGGPWSNVFNATMRSGTNNITYYYVDDNSGTAHLTASADPVEGLTSASGSINIMTEEETATAGQSSLTVDKSTVTAGEEVHAIVHLKNAEGSAISGKQVSLSSSRNNEDSTPDTISMSDVTNADGEAFFTVIPTQSGTFTLSAYNQSDSYTIDSKSISVLSGPLSKIGLSATDYSPRVNTSFELSTVLYDAFSNLITDTEETVYFSSSDITASFQNTRWDFTSSDQGLFIQGVTFLSVGPQTIKAQNADGSLATVLKFEVLNSDGSMVDPGENTAEALADTVPKKIVNSLNPITSTVATIGFLPLLVQAFPPGFHALAWLAPGLFAAVTFRRRRKPWGMVFDLLTNRPIDSALIRVFDAENKRLVATKVTDPNGRFSFLLSKGKYYCVVAKSGYLFPPKMSEIKADQLTTRFGPESDLYFGQVFAIQNEGTNINFNIALEPQATETSGDIKTKMWFKNSYDWFIIGLSYIAKPLMFTGALLAIITTFAVPTTLNYYLDGLYILLLVGFFITQRIEHARLSYIFDAQSGKPVPDAIISIVDEEYQAIRETKSSDKNGQFGIMAPKGNYHLTVEAPNYIFPAKIIREKDKKMRHLYDGGTITVNKNKFISVNIALEKNLKTPEPKEEI